MQTDTGDLLSPTVKQQLHCHLVVVSGKFRFPAAGADHFSSPTSLLFLIGFPKIFTKHVNIILSFKHSLQKKSILLVTFEHESISLNALRANMCGHKANKPSQDNESSQQASET